MTIMIMTIIVMIHNDLDYADHRDDDYDDYHDHDDHHDDNY